MAYLMTDVADGSKAALQIMQNMGAAPLAANVGKAQAELEIANTEKVKLQNLVADQGIKANAEVKAKAAALIKTPEYINNTDGDKQRQLASIYMGAGMIDEGSKLITASEMTDARAIANRQKELDAQAQQFGKTQAVVSALKTPEQIDGFFKELETKQPQAYKQLVDTIGPTTFNGMSSEQKKEALNGLMLNAKGQNAMQLKHEDLVRQQMILDSKERVAMLQANTSLQKKAMGGSRDDIKDWELADKRLKAIDEAKPNVERLKRLDKAVEDADAALTTARLSWTTREAPKADALTKAIEERAKFQREIVEQKINKLNTMPSFEGKKDIMEQLIREREMYPEPKPKPKEAEAKVTAPVAQQQPQEGAAPDAAVQMLKDNPTSQMKKAFEEKYGYLPEGMKEEDTTKYARTKGNRGQWVYTPSPRGITKKQYEELDSKR